MNYKRLKQSRACPICDLQALPFPGFIGTMDWSGIGHLLYHLSSGCVRIPTHRCFICSAQYPGQSWHDAAQHIESEHSPEQFMNALVLLALGRV